jgi:hypothetical protein
MRAQAHDTCANFANFAIVAIATFPHQLLSILLQSRAQYLHFKAVPAQASLPGRAALM